MKPTLTIFWKEIRGHLTSPSYYAITFFYTLLMSYLYFAQLTQFSQRSLQYMIQMQGRGEGLNLHQNVIIGHISFINLIFLFLVPIITVKYFTEEKKSRTFDLLLTSPINATQIVVGKMLAAVVATWILVLISLVFPLVTGFFAQIQWGVLLSAYVGIFLVAAIYAAIGVFSSSLTDSVLVSGFMGIVLCLFTWFVSWGSIVSENPTLQKVFNHISIANHFGQFVQGSVELVGFAFCLSLIFFFGFITQRVVESARWR